MYHRPIEEVEELLKSGHSPLERSLTGKNATHFITTLEQIRLFKEYKVDFNIPDANGNCLLHHLVYGRYNTDLVIECLKAGGSTNIKSAELRLHARAWMKKPYIDLLYMDTDMVQTLLSRVHVKRDTSKVTFFDYLPVELIKKLIYTGGWKR